MIRIGAVRVLGLVAACGRSPAAPDAAGDAAGDGAVAQITGRDHVREIRNDATFSPTGPAELAFRSPTAAATLHDGGPPSAADARDGTFALAAPARGRYPP